MEKRKNITRANCIKAFCALGTIFSVRAFVTTALLVCCSVAQGHEVKIGGNVYGGGNLASVGRGTSVTINQPNAEIGTILGSGLLKEGTGDVYGGGAKAKVDTARADVATADDYTVVSILNGTIYGNVYGGGLGDGEHAADVYGPVNVLVGTTTSDGNATLGTLVGGEVTNGMVFGGNNVNGTPKDAVTVDIYSTAHTSANTKPTFSGTEEEQYADYVSYLAVPANHATTQFAIQAVYGGGNKAGYTPSYAPATGNQATNVNIHGCDNTVKMVYGGGRSAHVGTPSVNANANVDIEGGRIDTLFAGGDGHLPDDLGGYLSADINGDVNATVTGGLYSALFALSNTSGDISGEKSLTIENDGTCDEMVGTLFGGSNKANVTGDVTLTVGCGAGHLHEIYGGSNMAEIINGNVTLNIYDGDFDYVFGGSKGVAVGDPIAPAGISADIKDYPAGDPLHGTAGNVTLNIYGGRIGSAFGGANANGNIEGNVQVNVDWDHASGCSNPKSLGYVYGAGNLTAYTPNDLAAGGKPVSPEVNIYSGTVDNDVFGGGYGSGATVTANPQVTINGAHAEVSGKVYGGGSLAPTTGNTAVKVVQGSVANVFGGGKSAGVSGTATVTIPGGTVSHGVYGGCDNTGTVTGAIVVDIQDGTIGTDGAPGCVHGGGLGQSTATGNNVTVNIGDGTATPVVWGDVYGGSSLGGVNGNTTHLTKVWLKSGTVNGSVYGGGMGQKTPSVIAATVNGNVQVIADDVTVTESVFGCNNLQGAPAGTVAVTVNSATVDVNVVGGGNEANYTGTPVVAVNGGEVLGRVIGGGNAANVGGTNVTIAGGTIGTGTPGTGKGVYGGCNTSGTVTGNVVVNVTGGTIGVSTTDTANVHGGGYGSGTEVDGNVTVTYGTSSSTHTVTPELFGQLYGGSALGTVNDAASDNTTVYVHNGTLHGNVYGGGLGNGTTAADVRGVVYVYIGANGSPYTGQADLTSSMVFGGNNANGTPQADVHVHLYKAYHRPNPAGGMSKDDAAYEAADGTFSLLALYGGGNKANYAPENGNINSAKKTHVYIHGCDNTVDQVFGGCNAAKAVGVSTIIDGGRHFEVFGGGNGLIVPAHIGLGGIYLEVKGGHVGSIFERCNRAGDVDGSISASVEGSNNPSDCNSGKVQVDNYFLGGNEADVVGDLIKTFTCTDAETYKYLYGGCRLGSVYGNIILTIEGGDFGTIFGGSRGVAAGPGTAPVVASVKKYDAGHYPVGHPELIGTGGNVTIILNGGSVGTVFGGCDLNGNVEGRITIIVDSTGTGCDLEINNIYGGGNLATYNPDTANSSNPYYDANYAYPLIDLVNGHVNGNVFGGGKGSLASVSNGLVNSNPYVHMHPDVDHSKKFRVKGNVYGGGELGKVVGNTIVRITNGSVGGSVYGGGKGDQSHEDFGLVAKNTWVDMQSGNVHRSVYGGGELGSVGTFLTPWGAGESDLHVAGEPKTCQTGTGVAKVTITGNSLVGLINTAIMPPPSPEYDDYGYIFCGSRGEVDSIRYPKANLLAIVDSTYLEIGGNALITASAYGGCENGQVLRNTYVKITDSCQIGVGYYYENGNHHFDSKYTGPQWNNASANPLAAASQFHEVSHWPFTSPYYIYDAYAQADGTYASGESARGGSNNPSNGHTFYGSVFGGGSGYYAIEPGVISGSSIDVPYHTWRRSAGRVNGNTKVDVDGGHILTNLYGGNEMTDVLGSCTVNFGGTATLGVPRTVSDIQAHPVTCYLFGAGKGDPRTFFNKMTNVGGVVVNVTGGRIFGSVFGGGEDGHVEGDVEVNINTSETIGTTGTSYVDGNIFGGGRGFDGIALTAGNVAGNIEVNIKQGTILGSVYGGGRLGSVGYRLHFPEEAGYGVMTTAADSGNIVVNITGGTIGNDDASDWNTDHSRGGNVYGASMGRLTKLDGSLALTQWHRLGAAKKATVNINDADRATWIKGNVYGGSELGRVTEDILVNISGTNVIIGRNTNSTTTSHGNVYGGGVGHPELTAAEKAQVGNTETSDSIPTFAGLTGGTIQVNISGGKINNNVYGAGELASVGTIDAVVKHTNPSTSYYLSWPYEYTYHGTSGDARVTITGGTIGHISGSDTSGGNIYGSARGTVGDRYVTGRLATARVTHVDINLTNPADKIIGDVYGSGENGHVYDSAVVTLHNGLVLGSVYGGGKGTDKYSTQLKNTSTDALYDADVYDIIAGKVFGNTYVNILGGRVAKNVYGGGNLASVGIGNYKDYGEGDNVSAADSLLAENTGHCYVTILDGIVGPDSLVNGTAYNGAYNVNTGSVYGAGKGIVFPAAAKTGFDYGRDYFMAYVNKTTVIFGDSTQRSCDHSILYPQATSEIFGGGENGHVRFDTYVQANRGQIGVAPLSNVSSEIGHWANRGNIFGAGRGEDKNSDGTYCQSAGHVGRNTRIDVRGGLVYRNVQGGGSMASVGPLKGQTGDSSICVVNIDLPNLSDSIGCARISTNTFGGYVSGGSRGIPSPAGIDNSGFATCRNSQINIRRGWLRNTIYGGGENGQMLENTEINVYDGYVRSAIYGGGKGSWKDTTIDTRPGHHHDYDNDTLSGYVAGNTLVNLLGGTVPFTYGGCRRANVGGNTTVNIGKDNGDGTYSGNVSFATDKRGVYGGNQYAGSPRGSIYVNVYKTAHTVDDAVSGTQYAIESVYGGSYNSHYTPKHDTCTAHVHVYGCDNTIRQVYGGAAASYIGSDQPGKGANCSLIIDGGRFEKAFGGGDGTINLTSDTDPVANVYGTATTAVHGGTIGSLFGGSNTRGTVKTINITVDNNGPCGGSVEGDEFFGGSNVADLGPTNLSTTLGCGVKFNAAYGGSNQADIIGNVSLTIEGGEFGEVYAGSKGSNTTPANIDGNTHLTVRGGKIHNAFGGSNINGNITGTITVDIDHTYNNCPWDVDYVYGGSNFTQYLPDDSTVTNHSPSPLVNLLCGTVDTNVYGGGKGDSTDYHAGLVRSNPKVVMSQGTKGNTWVKGNIYGGGEMATVGQFTSNPSDSVTTSVATRGNTYVLITGGTVGPANVDVTDINSLGNVYGGGLGKAGTNQAGTINYSHFNYVNTTRVEVSGTAHVRGSVFGGGENGHVFDSTKVAISGGTIGVRIPLDVRDYDPETTVGAESSHVYTGNVYGGGRGVDHSGSHLSLTAGRVYGNTNVTISDSAHIYHAVYGGGSFASVGTFTRIADASLFGGVDHEFTKGGRAIVTLTGGRIGPKWRDLLYDTHGNFLMNNAETAILTNAEYQTLLGSATPVSTADTIAKNFKYLGENEGMVYGSGRGMNYDNSGDPDHRVYSELAFTDNTFVTVSDTADIVGSVFGGGENGHVKGDTRVVISGGKIGGFRLHHNGFFLPVLDAPFNPDMTPRSSIRIEDSNEEDDELDEGIYGTGRRIFRGNVYGGGRGADHTPGASPENSGSAHIYSASAGRVYGNTNVYITGNARVLHNVFGGGSIASVGTYVYGNSFYTDPTDIHAGTGVATVVIDGGRIGITGENEGGVYGGGRGIAASSTSDATYLAYVDSTFVHITDGVSASKPNQFADVRGSVFGGGMNGHVLHGTFVNVSGGVVGGKMAFDYGHYDTISFPSTRRPSVVDTNIYGLDFYSGARHQDTLSDRNGRVDNGISVFLGNVYGGGRGVDHYTESGTPHISKTAGRVYGNTHVLITGGLVYHNVYGGGSVASVGRYNISGSGEVTYVSGGKATVDIRGGRFGTAGRNDGRIFGSSRGMAGGEYVNTSYVNIAHVIIGKADAGTAPDIRGSVFGGGENGHVLDSTLVTVNKGSIGRIRHTGEYEWVDNYVGNVYGAGRGVDLDIEDHHASRSAGWVKNSTHVIFNGGSVYGNVFGGASLGFVGDTATNGLTNTPVALGTTAQSGRTWIDVFGGHLLGSVFGAGRGRAGHGHLYGNDYTHHTWNANTVVRVNYSSAASASNRIDGSVYGGGLNGHVSNTTYVTLTRGEVGGSVYGGGSGEDTYLAFLRDASGNYLNASGNFVCDGSTSLETIRQGLAADGENDYKTIAIVDSLSSTAGLVRGNSFVLLNGADVHVVGNVFGGGALSHLGTVGVDTTGSATVEVTNGTVDGSLYGAGKGRGEDDFKTYCDVRVTDVDISGGQVKGDVYGGSQNGHVLENTDVNITGGTIGDATVASNALAGNVFGGGQGSGSAIDHDSDPGTPNEFRIYKHAGRVGGNTTVTLTAGSLVGSVFGGGRLALTGVDVNGDYSTYVTSSLYDSIHHGFATVTVSGGQIGIDNPTKLLECNWSIGDIMGAGKGDIDNYEDVWAGRVANTVVTISGSPVIRGSVYGGGEMASVGYWPEDKGHSFVAQTGTTKVDVTGGTIGIDYEYTVDPDHNPGDWTIYNSTKDTLIHTITGNIVGGSQGDVDLTAPHWISMGRSRTAVVNVGGTPTVLGNVYGGSEQGIVVGNTYVIINGGTFGYTGALATGLNKAYTGDIYAAGYGSDDPAEWDDSTPNDSTAASTAMGLGWSTGLLSGRTFGNSQVDILGGTINGSVYGGGSFASVGDDKSMSDMYTTSDFPVNGVTLVNIGLPGTDVTDKSQANGSALIHGDVFGGNNFKGTPYGNTNVHIYKTYHPVGTDAPTTASMKPLVDDGDELTRADLEANAATQGYALHAVYGGGNLAQHAPLASDGTTLVYVHYCDENTILEVYGGGNAAHTKNNNVVIDGGRFHQVFGGGNGLVSAANVTGTAKTEVHGGFIDELFGGSNTNGVIGNTVLNIDHERADGGVACDELIDQTYGGGNNSPGGGGEFTLTCGTVFEDFYAGARNADIGTPDAPVDIILNVEGGHINNLFGGSLGATRPANIYGNVTINFHGGYINNLFGGSDIVGNITGTIIVNVDIDPDYTCPDGLNLDTVYGGGRHADYTPTDPFRLSPEVNIMNNRWHNGAGTTSADSAFVEISAVFGGGLEASCTSYPIVVVGGFGDGTKKDGITTYPRAARIFGNVYGGGNAAAVIGNTSAIVRDAIIGLDTDDPTYNTGVVYGGGLGASAKVIGETYVGIFGRSDIKNNVYGGGNAGIVTGNTEIQIGYHHQILPPEIVAYRDGSDIKAGFLCNTADNLPAGKKLRFSYTKDGSVPPVPATGATLYENDFVIDWSDTVKCIAYLWDETYNKIDSSMIPSVVAFDRVTMPSITLKPAADASNYGKDTILFANTIGAKIYYTTDGTTPTNASTLWGIVGESEPASAPVTDDSMAVIKAYVEMRGCVHSEVAYLTADKPVITSSANTITLTAKPGERIIYTVDNSSEVSVPVSTMNQGVRPGGNSGETNITSAGDVATRVHHTVGAHSSAVTHYEHTYSTSEGDKTYRWSQVAATHDGTTPTSVTITVPTDDEYTVKAIVERTGCVPSVIAATVYRVAP